MQGTPVDSRNWQDSSPSARWLPTPVGLGGSRDARTSTDRQLKATNAASARGAAPNRCADDAALPAPV